MGKLIRAGSLLLMITLLFVLLVIPLSVNMNKVEANSYYWADSYGFMYQNDAEVHTQFQVDSNSPWGGSWSYGHNAYCTFSGIEKLFEAGYPSYPSTHKALCMKAWPSTYYCNASAYRAWENLKGNALFAFFGHGSYHNLMFYNWNSNAYTSALVSTPDHSVPGINWYVSDLGYSYLHDLAFAFLRGCKTGYDVLPLGSIGMYMYSCGVDTVLGFKSNVARRHLWPDGKNTYPGHIYNQEFWRASQILNQPVLNAHFTAAFWVKWHNKGDYDGHNKVKVFGNTGQLVNYPHNGT